MLKRIIAGITRTTTGWIIKMINLQRAISAPVYFIFITLLTPTVDSCYLFLFFVREKLRFVFAITLCGPKSNTFKVGVYILLLCRETRIGFLRLSNCTTFRTNILFSKSAPGKRNSRLYIMHGKKKKNNEDRFFFFILNSWYDERESRLLKDFIFTV